MRLLSTMETSNMLSMWRRQQKCTRLLGLATLLRRLKATTLRVTSLPLAPLKLF